MKYFDNDFNKFFIELSENNNRDWFLANKSRYEKSIKMPFFQLVNDLIDEINKNVEPLNTTAKESIFRINRDVRFSKDKNPYKSNVSAIISPKGRKDKENPGMYLEINPVNIHIYGGCYMPNTENLDKIRWHIMENQKKFNDIINDKNFVEKYGQLIGEKNKVLNKVFKDAAQNMPILYNKQYYYHAAIPNNLILTENLLDTIIEYYKAGNKLQTFFIDAINL